MPAVDTGWREAGPLVAAYQAEFPGIDRSIIGRADEGMIVLANGVPTLGTVQAGQTVNFLFTVPAGVPETNSNLPNIPPTSGLEERDVFPEEENDDSLDEEVHTQLKKRQAGQTVYVSVNMCGQGADQLVLYVSTSLNRPGPGQSPNQQQVVPLNQGLASTTISATGSVFIGITAPATNTGTSFSFTVGASINGPVQAADTNTAFAFAVDTDSKSALLTTFNLTDPVLLAGDDLLREQWLDLENGPPFSIYILDDNSLDGIQQSFCAISQLFVKNLTVKTGISIRNSGQNPKQDFLIEGLTAGTRYQAVLAYNGTAPGQSQGSSTLAGGKVYKPFTFTTKSGKQLHS
jgi:calcium channel MID1